MTETKSLALYEIADQYQFLLSELYDETTGEVNQDVSTKLSELKDTVEDKCINVVKVFKELDRNFQAIAEERKRMAAREKAYKGQIDWLKNYLKENMERCAISKIECPQFVIGLQNNRPSVDIEDESLIPAEYKKVTVEFKREDMNRDMANGVVIPGAKLIQTKSVRIR